MGNNIESWKTKKIKDLIIPLGALYNDTIREDWRLELPAIEGFDDIGIHISIPLCEIGDLTGTLRQDKTILISSLTMQSERSGTTFWEVIEPALHKSTGELNAVLIWESSAITRLVVRDGIVALVDIEL